MGIKAITWFAKFVFWFFVFRDKYVPLGLVVRGSRMSYQSAQNESCEPFSEKEYALKVVNKAHADLVVKITNKLLPGMVKSAYTLDDYLCNLDWAVENVFKGKKDKNAPILIDAADSIAQALAILGFKNGR